MASRTISVEIIGDASSLERSFNRAGKSATGFGKSLGGMAKAGAIGAAIGGIALLGKGLKDSVGAALEAEKAQTRFASAMDQIGASAQQRAAAQDAINKVSRQAALDDEALSDVYSKLARTTGDVTKAQEGMALAADIARARNVSLETAANAVEKAHVGQLRGLKALGIEIEKGTTATEALESAQQKFAGSAERYGRSAAGAQDKLGVAFENLQEKVGQKLLPVLAKLSVKLVELITWAETNWPRFAKSMQPVVDAFEKLWAAVQVFWKIAGPILEVALPIAIKAIGLQITIMVGIWQKMGDVVGIVVSGILKVIDKFLGGVQAVAEASTHIPFVGDKFKGVAEQVGNARAKVRELQSSIDSLRGKEITITTVLERVYKERTEVLPGQPIGRRAAGGPVRAGMPYIVGEKGRELFVPKQAGTIIPNGDGGGTTVGWGGGTVVNVYGDVTGNDLIETVRREINRIQKRNSTTGYV